MGLRKPAHEPYLGYVVFAGDIFAIRKLALKDGQIQITIIIHGPYPEKTGVMTVFGEDGKGCWQGTQWTLPEVHAREVVDVVYAMQLTAVEDSGEVRTMT